MHRTLQTIVITTLLTVGTACGVDKGPGITGAFFTYWERVVDQPIHIEGSINEASLEDIAFDGRPLFRADDIVWWVGTELANPVSLGRAQEVLVGRAAFFLRDEAGEWTRTADGQTFEPIEDIDALDEVNDLRTDRQGTLYASGHTAGVGRVYASEDDGRTWSLLIDSLLHYDPLLDVTFVDLVEVTGFFAVDVCANGALPGGDCLRYRGLPGDMQRFEQGTASLGLPSSPLGITSDGQVLARGRTEGRMFTTPDLVVFDPDDNDQPTEGMAHMHNGFVPIPLERMDSEGYGWGFGNDTETWGLFRTAAPLGRATDQRTEVLAGFGCANFYKKTAQGGYTGDEIEITVGNETGETVQIHTLANSSIQLVPGRDGVVELAPGDEATLTAPEEEQWIAITLDGRCKGYGKARKFRNKTLR